MTDDEKKGQKIVPMPPETPEERWERLWWAPLHEKWKKERQKLPPPAPLPFRRVRETIQVVVSDNEEEHIAKFDEFSIFENTPPQPCSTRVLPSSKPSSLARATASRSSNE
jgi:hypothetical protein